MRLFESCRRNARTTEKELFLRLPTVPNLQKAEFTNILLIYNERKEGKKKGVINVERGIAAFGEGYEQHGRQCGVKRNGKKKWKKVLTKACGGGIIAKSCRTRETSERNRGESRGVRTEVSSASESRGRQPGERTEVREPDVPLKTV